jgi:hypothetical protein
MAMTATCATLIAIHAIAPPGSPLLADGEELLVAVLLTGILVENTNGVEFGVVPTGSALCSFDTASLGFTCEFGGSLMPTQSLSS